MKNIHGDDNEQNQQENEEKREEDYGRRDVYEQTNPSNYYENMMNWEDEVIGAEDLLHVDDTLMSYGDFPPLPDFPCISSSSFSSKSSCSSSAPPPTSSINQHQHRGSVTCRNYSFSSSSATSSASSSASWAVGKSDHKENSVVEEKTRKQEYHDNRYGNLLSTTDSMEIQQDGLNRLDSGDCMDVMEGFGEMGLFDTDDIWDPSCLFPYEEEEFHQSKEDQKCLVDRENDDNDNHGDGEKKNKKPSEDLALVFLEWLKSNKETISAEDLRSIKLKRSTIECAAKRLGGGKEGMKQLLKLILEWVQNNHLQRKRLKENQASSFPSYSTQQQHHNPNPNSHEFSSFTPESNPACCIPTSNPWNLSRHPPPPPVVPPSTYMSDPMASGHAVYPPPMHGFINVDPSMFIPHFNQTPYPSSADYMFDASSHHQNWSHHPQPPPHHFSLSSHPYGTSYHHHDPHAHHLQPPPPPLSRSFSNYHQNQYQPRHPMFQGSNTTTTSSDGSLTRLGSSATKEARKKRMARQRRIFSHHQRHAQNNHQTNTTGLQQTRGFNDTTAPHQALNNPANWVFWSPSPPPPATTPVCGSMSPMMMGSDGPPLPADPPPQPTQSPDYHKQINMESRRHGCKPTEKNLKFLLQKVLKQSDVGNLGRIVLPKKEAEMYLPELEARDGISISMEDIGTSRVWNMRYRFWPNNKSRMYLLESTGDFVRSNGLQEGDFIVIYSDIKCGKFMIRGVKVRQPGSKSEAKKSAKAHRNLHANSPMCEGPSASMIKQAVA